MSDRRGALLLAACLLVPAGRAFAADGRDPAPPPTAAAILRHLDDVSGSEPQRLPAELAALGPRAVSAVLAAVREEGVAAVAEDAQGTLSRSLLCLPAAHRDAALAPMLRRDAAIADRLFALDVLEVVDPDRFGAHLLDAVASLGESEPVPVATGMELASRLAACLAADAALEAELTQRWPRLVGQAQAIGSMAVDRLPGAGAVRFCENALRVPGIERATLLARIANAPLHHQRVLQTTLPVEIAQSLSASESRERREAAKLVRALRLTEFTSDLLRLLDDEGRGVSQTASSALKDLTGKNLRDAASWRRWLEHEEDWAAARLPRTLNLARDADTDTAVRAIEALVARPFHRERALPVIARRVAAGDDEVRLAATRALAALGGVDALDPLADALFDTDERVRGAALEALRRLTGLDIGDDAAAWGEVLRPR